MHNIWNIVLYKPFVNVLTFLVTIIPGGNVGVAIIVLTLLVKAALIPLSHRSIESQAKMKLLEPEMKKIKTSGATKEEQAKQTMELYKKYNTNPFSGCLLVLIQIPIIFALYYAFYKGLNFNSDILYPFIHVPQNISMSFLWMDIGQKSMLLAVLAGASQFLQAHYMPQSKPATGADKGSFQDSFAQSMQMQMKYILPILIVFIAYNISGAVALYWITSNMFTVAQQIHVQKKKINLELSAK